MALGWIASVFNEFVNSTSSRIIRSFVRQLNGKIESIEDKPGTHFKVSFSEIEAIGTKKSCTNAAFKRDNILLNVYFTFSTIALNASGLFIAKSAKTLRFNSMLLAFNLPMNTE